MQNPNNEIVDSIVDDPLLVFRFFSIFSRFECALKRSAFLQKNERASVDWDAYANSVRGRFETVAKENFTSACHLLKTAPPKTQIVVNDQLSWADTLQGAGESEERYLLRLVSTVRNNLFHGGKYPYPAGPVEEVARNRQLLEAGIVVLQECLFLSPNLRKIFQEMA